jgi:hypothetical protein
MQFMRMNSFLRCGKLMSLMSISICFLLLNSTLKIDCNEYIHIVLRQVSTPARIGMFRRCAVSTIYQSLRISDNLLLSKQFPRMRLHMAFNALCIYCESCYFRYPYFSTIS